jgi:tether containing UBX domain for GLUT4
MSSVTVLTPNSRREQIKVQPSTKILEIIDEVCKKHGLNSNEYDIIHQRRRLDLTLTFHLSGVPKNAQLELKKLDVPRKMSDVTIAFQIEDNSRLPPLTFNPTETTLFKVIESYVESNACGSLKDALVENNTSGKYPTCSYLNESIIGSFQLKNTTLKDLGE